MPGDDIRIVKRRHSADLLRREGVSGFGIERDGDGREILVLHVSSTDPNVVSRLPAELDGYPVRIVSSGPFRKLDG